MTYGEIASRVTEGPNVIPRRQSFDSAQDRELVEGPRNLDNVRIKHSKISRGAYPTKGTRSDISSLKEDYETDSSKDFFPDTQGRYDFSTLLRITKDTPSRLSERLWEAAWDGRISNDTFMSVRRGIENRFQVPDPAETALKSRHRRSASGVRSGFSKWKRSLPFVGNWFRLSNPDLSGDILEKEERKKDRVRLLLERYGILFRELLTRETPPFQWSSLFRSLRLMELSGEVLAGYFFHGIPGPQFISHRAFRMLQRKMPEDRVFWINAADPASLCGVPLDALKGTLPRRAPSTHLVYSGKRLSMVSTGHGKTLTFYVPPEDAKLQQILVPLRHLLTRRFEPLRRITIETINGEEAARSPYLDALRISFEIVVDYKKVSLFSSATKR
jgi:ATP-dependent Lhr-like helicase